MSRMWSRSIMTMSICRYRLDQTDGTSQRAVKAPVFVPIEARTLDSFSKATWEREVVAYFCQKSEDLSKRHPATRNIAFPRSICGDSQEA
jgi:hypothetical protein